jgi:hypothetical protein
MRKQKEDKMLEDIRNNNKISNNYNDKTLLIVTDNIQQYQQQFSNYNINNYKITLINWNDILTFITNFEDNKHKNLELVILDIDKVGVEESEKIKHLLPLLLLLLPLLLLLKKSKKHFPIKEYFLYCHLNL